MNTISISINNLWQYLTTSISVADVESGLQQRLAGYVTITQIRPPIISMTYDITFDPRGNSAGDVQDAFISAFRDLGFSDAVMTAYVAGSSPSPGMISTTVQDMTNTISTAAGNATGNVLKPLFPYLFLGGIAYLSLFRKGKK